MDINLPMSPPVNNNIQISLNDKLDAIVFEKIRVVNSQLDSRLSLQEKIINKYRQDVEKIHAHQTQRLRREVKKIREKKPDYVFDDSDTSTSKSRFTTETGRQRCSSEPSSLSYCRRFYAHHYNVKDASRDDKKGKEGKRNVQNDFFNMKLRLYFVNMMNKTHPKTHLEHDSPDEFRRASNDMELFHSFDQSRHSQIFTRNPSTDDENDDVFANSHTSFKSARESYASQTGNKTFEFNTDRSTETATDSVANVSWNGKRGQRKSKGGKGKRRSVIGSGSEAEIEYNEEERRKSKHAFEKIFAGLL